MGYKLKTTKEDLYNKGFHYNKLMSDDGLDCYSIRIPALKYKKTTTVECEITVALQTGVVLINVFNGGTNDFYSPYYFHEYGTYKTLDEIEKAIKNFANKVGMQSTEKRKKQKK